MNNNLDVLILFSTSTLGGAERSLSRMALASSEVSYRLSSIQGEGPWSDWISSLGEDPILFGRNSLWDFSLFVPVVKLILYLRSNPDSILYVCGGGRLTFIVSLLRFLYTGTTIVQGVRWNPSSNSNLDRVFRFIERYLHRSVDGWISNSKAAKDTLVQRCGIDKRNIYVIYNGIDTVPEYSPNFDVRPLEVLTVANLNPRKGHREFLNVIHKVVQRVPDVRFVFIGRDDMNGAVQQAVTEAGLDAYVRYEGFQSDVTPWFKRARLFVLPSLWNEGSPTSILEAFSFAVPVIAHAIDGVPELVDDGSDGYLVLPMDKAFPDRIVELLLDPVRAESMGQIGRNKVIDHFMLSTCIRQHEAVFKRLVNK